MSVRFGGFWNALDSILKNVKQDDSNNEVTGQAAASKSTIFWMALSAR
jgi:hypothetical protein